MNENATSEETVGRFSGWFRRRPNSLEFWELVVTGDRIVWCIVGETFRSPLLRADMGERSRDELADLSVDEVAAYDDRNFTVPIGDLVELRLVPGTWLRRERLVVRWRDGDGVSQETLYRTKHGRPEAGIVEDLAADPRFDEVEVSVDPAPTIRRRLGEGLG